MCENIRFALLKTVFKLSHVLQQYLKDTPTFNDLGTNMNAFAAGPLPQVSTSRIAN